MISLGAHGILACVELACYLILSVPIAFNAVRYASHNQTGWLYVGLFVLVKIVGAAILIGVSSNPATASIGIQVAVQILYSIVLSPLLSATLAFINVKPTQEQRSSRSARGLTAITRRFSGDASKLLRLVHLILLAALVLSIVGGVDRAPSGSTGKVNPAAYDKGATLLKTSAILFLIAYLATIYAVKHSWATGSVACEPAKSMFNGMVWLLPVILVRVVYTLLIDFNLDTTTSQHTDKFNIITGSWVIYFFLGLLPQLLVVIICAVAGVVGSRRVGKVMQ